MVAIVVDLLGGADIPEDLQIEALIFILEHQEVAHIMLHVFGETLSAFEDDELVIAPLKLHEVLTSLCTPDWHGDLGLAHSLVVFDLGLLQFQLLHQQQLQFSRDGDGLQFRHAHLHIEALWHHLLCHIAYAWMTTYSLLPFEPLLLHLLQSGLKTFHNSCPDSCVVVDVVLER